MTVMIIMLVIIRIIVMDIRNDSDGNEKKIILIECEQ
jgi:hypothetical protein